MTTETTTPEPQEAPDPSRLTAAVLPPGEEDLSREELEQRYPKNDYSKVPSTAYANCPGCGYKFVTSAEIDPATRQPVDKSVRCGQC